MNKINSTIKLLLLSAVLGLTAVSCQDALDIVQSDELNDNITFNNVADLNNYLSGAVYSSVNTTSEIKFTSVFTDELGIAPTNTGQDIPLHRFFLDNSDGYSSGIWQTHYTTINRVNRLLKAAAAITPAAGAETATYNSILAQARALRAFAYIQLQSYFTTDMKDDNALGVILSLEASDDLYQKLPRVKNGDIYNQIDADLNFAYNNVAVQNSPTSYYYVSKPMIDALRARVNLNRGKYALAKQYAQAAVTGSGVTLSLGLPRPSSVSNDTPPIITAYPLGSTNFNNIFYNEAKNITPYRQMFYDRRNTAAITAPYILNSDNPAFEAFRGENIWALSRPLTGGWGNIASLYTTNTSSATGSPLFDMGRNLFNILNANQNDVRRWTFVDPTSKVAPGYATDANYVLNDVLIIDKYPGKGNQPLRNDIKAIRLSEMYLIMAEADAYLGNLSSAATYVKNVRDARQMVNTATTLPVYSDLPSALKDILRERRAELCFEGHRYVDLRRSGKAAGVSIDRHFTDDRISSLPTTLDINSYKFTLPIPLSEVQGNTTIVQNPGY